MRSTMPVTRNAALGLSVLVLLGASAVRAAPPRRPPPAAPVQAVRIVAVVNGQPITNLDVLSRTRLFAVATGLPVSQELLDRLKPQITRQLVDERLRMQAIADRHIVVTDQQVAAAITEIEQRNNMKPGGLRAQLEADGVSFTTLIDQVRTEIGWTTVLRRKLGAGAVPSATEVAAQEQLQAQELGRPEYHVGEIFIPVEERSGAVDAQRFAQSVITELRRGAPFPVVAAQFSQNQSALTGGDLGWVQPNQLEPSVAQLITEMPVGAVSNPIEVPGGLDIVTLYAKRQIGNDMANMLSVRQVFLPFTGRLNPQAPTPEQMALLQQAKKISADTKSCPQMEQVARDVKSPRPADPGPLRLDTLSPPAFRDMIARLPLDTASQPVVAPDGIAVLMVCSREQQNVGPLSAQKIKQQMFQQRIDLASRQLLQELRSQATIEIRGNGTT